MRRGARLRGGNGSGRRCRVRRAHGRGAVSLDWRPGEACLVNLPLYNGIAEIKLGIDAAATVSAPPPHASGVTKPVVFYGTSITHGGCASRPDVPLVFAEACDVWCGPAGEMDRFIRGVYEKLTAEGWKKLVYLPKTNMYPGDAEGTVDGCHPNDLGMMSLAKAFGQAVSEALRR